MICALPATSGLLSLKFASPATPLAWPAPLCRVTAALLATVPLTSAKSLIDLQQPANVSAFLVITSIPQTPFAMTARNQFQAALPAYTALATPESSAWLVTLSVSRALLPASAILAIQPSGHLWWTNWPQLPPAHAWMGAYQCQMDLVSPLPTTTAVEME